MYCHSPNLVCKTAVLLAGMLLIGQARAQLFPSHNLYPVYIADPLRPTFNAQLQRYSKTTITSVGDKRFDLKLGGKLPLYEWQSATRPWQLVLIAGFHGQFDNTQSQDNIGWDGIYGLHLATRLSDELLLRIGSKHISAHVGDEYIESTGRTRIEYTREELRAGLAWSAIANTTAYAELGHAYDLRNETLQEPWRAQLGAQYASARRFWQEQLNWYVAADISSFEENDWDYNTTLQVGVTARSGAHRWRLGLEFYDGRSQLGEFFQDNERYWALGLWLDL